MQMPVLSSFLHLKEAMFSDSYKGNGRCRDEHPSNGNEAADADE